MHPSEAPCASRHVWSPRLIIIMIHAFTGNMGKPVVPKCLLSSTRFVLVATRSVSVSLTYVQQTRRILL